MYENAILKLQESLGKDRVLLSEPMSRHTTFRIGGPAQGYIQTNNAAELAETLRICREEDVPYTVIGNGSNLLVADRGITGIVISLGGSGEIICKEAGNKVMVTVWGGELLVPFSKQMTKQGLVGLEWASGIPGTVGGAVRMNAGAYDGCIKDYLQSVEVLTKDNLQMTLTADELQLGYRNSCVEARGYTIVSATFLLTKGDKAESEAKIAELTAKRKEKQPLNYPSAGSTFKRPEGYYAGKLIQDAGLRGYRVGDAQVSEKHCGFVVNLGNATAADVLNLITDVQEKILAGEGVRLEPEVRFLGDFSDVSERVKKACRLPQM